MSGPDLTGPGTAESRWRSSPLLTTLPGTSPERIRPPGRVVVVAPHPDDETLGAGGTLASWAAAGSEVVVVAVTDGEGSHPDSPTLGPRDLAVRRHAERRRALEELGLGQAVLHRAGLTDGSVPRGEAALADVLDEVVQPGDTLLAPLPGDGHPDHDATASVVDALAARRGLTLWCYAVWFWHWADPQDPGLPRCGAVAVTPPEAVLRAKRDAVACFTTQIQQLSADPRDAAVLPSGVLARLLRDVEVLWRAS